MTDEEWWLDDETYYLLKCGKLEKKLEIATKALKEYADTTTWDCCERCQCAYVDGSVAAVALKEMEEIE